MQATPAKTASRYPPGVCVPAVLVPQTRSSRLVCDAPKLPAHAVGNEDALAKLSLVAVGYGDDFVDVTLLRLLVESFVRHDRVCE